MRGSTAFKRSNNQGQHLQLNYLGRMSIKRQTHKPKPTSQSRASNNGGGNHQRGKTANKKNNNKVNPSKHQHSKIVKPEAQEVAISDFEHFEAIISSSSYQMLSYQYSKLKRQLTSATNSLKGEIVTLNHTLRREEIKLVELSNLRQNLRAEQNYLQDLYEELRLKNYQLRCQLYRQRGFGQQHYYDSQQEIESSEMGYEQMMELREQFGVVEVGFDDEALKKIKGHPYKLRDKQLEERCCICCESFENNQMVFNTTCGHVHHIECLRKWLKVKRQCPLCRGQISHL